MPTDDIQNIENVGVSSKSAQQKAVNSPPCDSGEQMSRGIRKGGATGTLGYIEGNLCQINEVVQRARQNGNPSYLQPEAFSVLERRDAIYIKLIGEQHFFTLLYVDQINKVFISGGENDYPTNIAAQKIFKKLLPDVKIKFIPFIGQQCKTHSGSSAAAIAIEFQKIYRSRRIPSCIKPTRNLLERLRKSLHKVPEPRINSWVSIHEMQSGITCDICGRCWRYGKRKSILNFHKCKPTPEW